MGASPNSNGTLTWLHHLFRGTTELEWGDVARAAASLRRSRALRPSAHAARNLALLAPSASEAWALYNEAWELYRVSAAHTVRYN